MVIQEILISNHIPSENHKHPLSDNNYVRSAYSWHHTVPLYVSGYSCIKTASVSDIFLHFNFFILVLMGQCALLWSLGDIVILYFFEQQWDVLTGNSVSDPVCVYFCRMLHIRNRNIFWTSVVSVWASSGTFTENSGRCELIFFYPNLTFQLRCSHD